MSDRSVRSSSIFFRYLLLPKESVASKARRQNRFVSLVDYINRRTLSTMNKPPEEQGERATKRGRHARTPEARGAGRPGNYVRNSLARVNIERDRGRAHSTHSHARLHTYICMHTYVCHCRAQCNIDHALLKQGRSNHQRSLLNTGEICEGLATQIS